jgi:hypothetical protein
MSFTTTAFFSFSAIHSTTQKTMPAKIASIQLMT